MEKKYWWRVEKYFIKNKERCKKDSRCENPFLLFFHAGVFFGKISEVFDEIIP